MEVPNEFIEILKSYGLAGVVMGALAWFCYKLYTRNQELHDTLNEVGREAVKANEQVANALRAMADVNQATVTSMQQINANVQQLLWRHGLKVGNGGE